MKVNKEADKMAKEESTTKFVEPEPVLWILMCQVRAVIDRWIFSKDQKRWNCPRGHIHIVQCA